MILPIVAYGHPILRKKCDDVDINSSELPALIDNMFETMYDSNGVGLAAPQINEDLRLFIIDSTNSNLDEARAKDNVKGYKGAFINPVMIEEYDEPIEMEEGCLSIPKVYGMVTRPSKITIEFFNEKLEKMTLKADGFTARVIQHEYDHINGVLFLDHLKPLKKENASKKLDKISNGDVGVSYKMLFAKKKR